MKKIYLITLLVILTISFTACGGSNTNSIESEVEEATPIAGVIMEKIGIDIDCIIPVTIDSYIELQKGDKIVKDEDNSTIIIYHDENGKKRTCLESGVAHIERKVE